MHASDRFACNSLRFSPRTSPPPPRHIFLSSSFTFRFGSQSVSSPESLVSSLHFNRFSHDEEEHPLFVDLPPMNFGMTGQDLASTSFRVLILLFLVGVSFDGINDEGYIPHDFSCLRIHVCSKDAS